MDIHEILERELLAVGFARGARSRSALLLLGPVGVVGGRTVWEFSFRYPDPLGEVEYGVQYGDAVAAELPPAVWSARADVAEAARDTLFPPATDLRFATPPIALIDWLTAVRAKPWLKVLGVSP